MTRNSTETLVDDPADGSITLGVLNAVEENSHLTQRSMARDLGIALGLANAYLKRCVRKGLVKVQQVPSNRYAYYLTPRGFSEKSRLTSEYLSSSLAFFRKARVECEALIQSCEDHGYDRVGLLGVSDLADVVALSALDSTVEIAGIVDETVSIERYAGHEIVPTLDALGPIDAIIFTTVNKPIERHAALCAAYPKIPVLAPPLLKIPTSANTPSEGGDAGGPSTSPGFDSDGAAR